jgi:soluble lytic murein transglycosylase-like protein
MNNAKRLWLVAVFSLVFHSVAYGAVDLSVIKHIESRGNPVAYNKKSGARGLYQITPICLKEYNNFHPKQKYTKLDLFRPDINKKIAEWYLNKRIPQLLKYYGLPVTIENTLWAYNAGIGKVVKNIQPTETKNYIKHYREGVSKS